jgi:hypothetical protein
VPHGQAAGRATQVRVLRGQAPDEVGAALQSWRPNLLYLCGGQGAGGALLPLRLQPAAAAAAAAASNGAAPAAGPPAPAAEAGAERSEGAGGRGGGGAGAASEGRAGDAADARAAPMDTDGGRRRLPVACAAPRSAGCCCRVATGCPCGGLPGRSVKVRDTRRPCRRAARPACGGTAKSLLDALSAGCMKLAA